MHAFLMLAMATLFAAPALAADAPAMSADISKAPAGTYVLEKNHASIVFKAMHLGLANYTMRFNEFDATLTLDPAAPEKSKVEASINPASFDSNNAEMTKHMSSKDFFNIAQFPSIRFVSTKIEKTGASKGKLHGDLTLLGVTKPVVLEVTFNNGGTHPMLKKQVLGFSATTSITRSQFGMNYGIGMVSDAIPVAFELEFVQQ